MSATTQIVSSRVGDGGSTSGTSVTNLQELLRAAGCTDPAVSGTWGKGCNKALNEAQDRHHRPIRNYCEPGDDIILDLCKDADILIPVSGKPNITGVDNMDWWAFMNDVPYEPGGEKGLGTRAFYGLNFRGGRDWLIQRNHRAFQAGPVMFNCTTWVNVLIGLYLQGHVHGSPYDGDCGGFGAVSGTHIARDRYKFILIRRPNPKGGTFNYFEPNCDQIMEATNLGALYQLEIGKGASGGVTHMAVMYNYLVYECTTGQEGSACITRALDDFLAPKQGSIIYLFGEPSLAPPPGAAK